MLRQSSNVGYLALLFLVGGAGCGGDAPLPSEESSAVGSAVTTWWHPLRDASWDWQLAVPVNTTSANVDVYDIDMFDNQASVVTALHNLGRKVICYVDVGSWEQYRPDASQFPTSVRGASYDGFPDERWLDIRRIDLLAPPLRARLDQAKQKGCDAVEPDNMDGYDTTAHESSGFPLTYQDQITFNRFIATEVHARGMGVGLKNDINQTKDLVNDFDFVVSEQAFQYNEYTYFANFTAAGKPIFEAEYKLDPSKYCAKAKSLHISAIRKKNSLNSYRVGCEGYGDATWRPPDAGGLRLETAEGTPWRPPDSTPFTITRMARSLTARRATHQCGTNAAPMRHLFGHRV